MPSPRTMNRRGEGRLLREEILHAATRLLGEASSRDAVTLRAIARETGIAPPSIYKHFTDRDAVLDAVVSATFTQLEAVCEHAFHRAVTGRDRVRAIGRDYVAFATQHQSEYRILFERSVGNLATDARPFPSGIRAFEYFVDAFAQMVTEGASTSTDPARDAQALWAALHGVVTLLPATPGFPWAPADDIVDRLIENLAG